MPTWLDRSPASPWAGAGFSGSASSGASAPLSLPFRRASNCREDSLAPRDDGEAALEALLQAGEIYRRTPGGEVHAAHIDMHLAVQALATGQLQMAIDLCAQALPAALRTENAAFIASLGFIRAEALALQGRTDEARRLSLDSMAAARYGFGSESAVQARRDEIARIGNAAQTLARL